MEILPTKNAEKGVNFTVADFLEAGRERLRLSLVVGGAGMNRVIAEPTVNRLGLGLTGFFKCFAHRRLHVVGNAERAYLASLPPDERAARFRAVLDHGARMFVYTGGHKPAAGAVRLVEEYGAVLLQTALATRAFNRDATFVMEELGAPRTSIYGTMVEVCGLGVLFEGDPGLGKSETALGLIKNGAALVADDLTCVRKDVAKNMLYGSASESTAGFMEIRGIGIMHVPRVFGVNAVRGEKRLHRGDDKTLIPLKMPIHPVITNFLSIPDYTFISSYSMLPKPSDSAYGKISRPNRESIRSCSFKAPGSFDAQIISINA